MPRKAMKNCIIDDLTRDYENCSLLKRLRNDLVNTSPIETENCEADSVSDVETPLHSFDDYDETKLLEKLSVLRALRKKERELKIGILHEKYMKEDVITTDETLLSEKITELKDVVQERKANLKMADTMCSKAQLAEVLQKIILPFCRRNENKEKRIKSDKEDEIQSLILGLVLRKKEIEKEISRQQQEIVKLEENCLELKTIIDYSICEEKTDGQINETKNMTTNSKDNEELTRLKAENKKRNDRIQLLSRTLHILITNVESESSKDDLKILASSCENILKWDYDNIDAIEELCKSVYSTKI